MSWNPLKFIAELFANNDDAAVEPDHREFAKDDIQTRLGGISEDVGEIVDYYVSDVSNTRSDTDYRYVVDYESEKFGDGSIYLNPPEQGESWSQLHGFMAAIGASAVDALDEMVGEDLELTLAEDGTVSAVWDDPGEGSVFVNTEPAAQTDDDPVIEDVFEEETADDEVPVEPVTDLEEEAADETEQDDADADAETNDEEATDDQEDSETADETAADEESDETADPVEVSGESESDTVDDSEVTEEEEETVAA